MNEFVFALDFMGDGLSELFTRFFPLIGFGFGVIIIVFLVIYCEWLRKQGKEDV